MSSQPLLSGKAQPDEVARLRREMIGLEAELKQAKEELAQVKQASKEAIQIVARIQEHFQPEYDFLRVLFAQMSPMEAGKEVHGHAHVVNNLKWDSWKKRLGGKKAECIEVLELGDKTRGQLRAAINCGWSTIDAILKELRDVGVVEKVGNQFSLKG